MTDNELKDEFTDTVSVTSVHSRGKLLSAFLAKNHEWQDCPDYLIAPPDAEEIAKDFPDVDSAVLSDCLSVIQVVGDRIAITRGAFYCMLREGGSSDKFAAMLSLQRGPGLNTDDTFFSGMQPLYDQFGSQKHLDRYLQSAKRQGFTPPVHSKYFPELARFPGDKEAWVTRAMGRSYIRKLCEKRGWACEGAVNVAAREPEEDPLADRNCRPLGEDIIRDRARQMVSKSPELAKMSRSDLRQHVINKHGPQKVS